MKDKNQTRVLALDIDRVAFERILSSARLSHGGIDAKCKDGSVTVQWDPERQMDVAAPNKQAYTSKLNGIKSIQIGLRGNAVQELLDPEVVLRISDVTDRFREAHTMLDEGNVRAAAAALWPTDVETAIEVPGELRSVLSMDQTPSTTS